MIRIAAIATGSFLLGLIAMSELLWSYECRLLAREDYRRNHPVAR